MRPVGRAWRFRKWKSSEWKPFSSRNLLPCERDHRDRTRYHLGGVRPQYVGVTDLRVSHTHTAYIGLYSIKVCMIKKERK